MARQIEKGRLATFGIGILASLIPVAFIGILVGMVMLATSRLLHSMKNMKARYDYTLLLCYNNEQSMN